jgi:2-dehydro-3-deoxyphosphogluconate aldolase/(4S)-4-hydroxy-2-oxoglutarate aldolase
MAKLARLEVLQAILESGLVPTFRHEQPETALSIARALAAGGARAIELLARWDGAIDVFRAIVPALRRDHPRLAIGIGSMVDAPTTALYLALGADFVVGPGLNPRIARLCNRRKIAYLPGCGTVSEISQAEELGCEIVKLFPSSAMNGPEFVRSLRGPMPWSRVMPTGNGVAFTESSVRDWIAAGACAVGMGDALTEPRTIAASDFATISARTRQALAWIAAARA